MRKIDVYTFIAQQRPIAKPLIGEAEISHFRRFCSDLPTQKLATESSDESQEHNRVYWQVDGEQLSSEVYPHGRYLLHFFIEADPVVICQRCMKPFRYALRVESTVEVVRSVHQLEEVGESGEVVLDDYEKVVADPYLDILELIEDELILALPFMPSHESCEEGSALLDEYATPVEESPFAVLKNLKKN
ncbi:hypothetical protein AAEX37_02188 [Oligella sp. MSHR50489EDL]|uniref:YceD family protein n=1 Tax=Oligella sp. MSHR50489EDL TaxID=3139409 RepID=UPI003D8148F8